MNARGVYCQPETKLKAKTATQALKATRTSKGPGNGLKREMVFEKAGSGMNRYAIRKSILLLKKIDGSNKPMEMIGEGKKGEC